MRFSSKNRTDYLVVGASALIITACSVLLYADYARRADSGGARRIGTITFKKEVAQRKYQSQVIWEDLDRDAPVYNNDTIRTADLSEAVISLADGTKINMDENSLILLEMSGKGINIDFSSGSISADRADARDQLRDPKPGHATTWILGKTQHRQHVLDVRGLQKLQATELDEGNVPPHELQLHRRAVR